MRRRIIQGVAIIASTLGIAYATTVVTSDPTYSPKVITAPVVTGDALIGQPLACATGTWKRTPTTYTIAWENSPNGSTWNEVATGSPYVVAETDEDDTLRCRVTAANARGTGQSTSTPTGTVAALNPLLIVTDSFTDTDATTLASHVGEVGADWTKHPSFAQDATITSNHVRGSGSSTLSRHYASGVPENADYDVIAVIRSVTPTVSNDITGVWGRASTTVDNAYGFRYNRQLAAFQLLKVVSGTATTLGTCADAFAAGSVKTIKLEMRGTAIKGYLDDVLCASATDSAITAAGRVGIATRTSTATDGAHLDSIYAAHPDPTPPAAECADGINNDAPEDILIDLADPGCVDAADDDETDPLPEAECEDGLDNDGDTEIDFPDDPGCTGPTDEDETDPTQCADGVDNADAEDVLIDLADPGCIDALDDDETDPPPPPPPGAQTDNVFVSATGSDTGINCVRFTAAVDAPADQTTWCATLNKGYQLAACDDTVGVSSGDHKEQGNTAEIKYSASKDGCTGRPVVMRPIVGGDPKVTMRDSGTTNLQFLIGGGSFSCGVRHLTFDGIDFETTVYVGYKVTGCTAPATNITFRNLTIDVRPEATRMQATGARTAATIVGTSDGVTFRNVVWETLCCDWDLLEPVSGVGSPLVKNFTLDYVTMYPVDGSCANIPADRWPDCATESIPYNGNHIDCFQSYGIEGLTVTNSKIYGCNKWQNGSDRGHNTNHLYQNNVFELDNSFRLNCSGGGSPCDVSSTEYAYEGFVKLYYNTFIFTNIGFGWSIGDWNRTGTYHAVGNIVAGPPPANCVMQNEDLGSDTTWDVIDNNLWSSNATQCSPYGTGNFNGTASYVATSYPEDFRLTAGSDGVDDGEAVFCPALDLLGIARPVGSACDLGAYERA